MEYEKIKYDRKGITLIALVITMIVLLILAGISIGRLTGVDGIINKSKFAAFSTKIREYQDNVERCVIDAEQKSGHEKVELEITDSEKMKDILGENMESGDENKYVVQENELRYNPDAVTAQEENWLVELGVPAMTI